MVKSREEIREDKIKLCLSSFFNSYRMRSHWRIIVNNKFRYLPTYLPTYNLYQNYVTFADNKKGI
jgi:hypothetical protein